VSANLPAGAAFDGYVQGMGFRFKTEELVVPMRLSAFNAGDLRNIVYLLSDSPRKIRKIPEEYVVRQIAGDTLHRNLTGPLPLRIIGGTEADIPQYRRKSLKTARDPAAKNGVARELFAADLLAAATQQLALPQEENEKVLLNIGERLNLRGADIDKVNMAALKAEREQTLTAATSKIKDVTLTVIDGDFPREVLANHNLTFASYRMPAVRNTPQTYNAIRKGPQPKQPGIRKTGALGPQRNQRIISPTHRPQSIAAIASTWAVVSLLLAGIAVTWFITQRRFQS